MSVYDKMSFGTLFTHQVREKGRRVLFTNDLTYVIQTSPRHFAILAVAKAQGLDLDIIYAEKDNKENYEKLLAINPLGQVPVLVGKDGHVLTECIPIALYRTYHNHCFPIVCAVPWLSTKAVTSQSDTTTLLGTNRRDYYNILKWMSLANSDLLPAVGGVIVPLFGKHLAVRKNTDDCLKAFYADCKVLDDHLKEREYLVGGGLTLADLFTAGTLVFPFAVFHKVLLRQYPQLADWFHKVYGTPMFKEVSGNLQLLDIPFPSLPGESD